MDKLTNDDQIISIKLVRSIFNEMFIKQQNDILKLISGNLKLTNDRIDGLLKEITNIKELCATLQKENTLIKEEQKNYVKRLKKNENVQKDIEDSLNFTQDIQEKKNLELEKKIISKSASRDTEDNKLRQLEDRQRRNNLRIEGLSENEKEYWDETELKVLNIFEEKLNLKGIVIERAHRSGKIEAGRPRSIVMKLLNYKDKVQVLKSASKLKGSGIYINEDYPLETASIRKKLFEQMKIHRKNGMFSVVIYDKLIVKEFRKLPSNL
ncbi:uncharacterized protein LOC136096051 [Hydra vulgaris]|uniref:uncharacterized protein LOC136096051 n=1 Tax=Hydra vulgaris TaxID=6087 RepID=UPI0032EA5614